MVFGVFGVIILNKVQPSVDWFIYSDLLIRQANKVIVLEWEKVKETPCGIQALGIAVAFSGMFLLGVIMGMNIQKLYGTG